MKDRLRIATAVLCCLVVTASASAAEVDWPGDVPGDVEKLKREVEALLDEVERLQEEQPVVRGMVAAFDGQCPDGWSEYEQAQGRFVIGVSEEHSLEIQGGVRQYQLTKEELPDYRLDVEVSEDEHDHTFRHSMSRCDTDAQETWHYVRMGRDNCRYTKEFGTTGHAHRHSVIVRSGGDGRPHDHLPPFVALRFCKRD